MLHRTSASTVSTRSLSLAIVALLAVFLAGSMGSLAASAAPQVPTGTSLTPNSGPPAGGTSVTITGTGFVAGSTSVTFGGTVASTVTVNSSTSLTVSTPAHAAGPVGVTVTTADGTSSPALTYTYANPAPVITSIDRSSGPAGGGSVVNITGTDFANATSVQFGTTTVSHIPLHSPTSIAVTSPAGIGTVDITITTSAGTSATSAADRFTYTTQPTISALNPSSGPQAGGTSVSITGTSFSTATSVMFGGAPAASFTIHSDTSLTAVSPAGFGSGLVTVATSGGVSDSQAQFFWLDIPVITAISRTGGSALGGTSVVLTGTGFLNVTTVQFGAVASPSFIVDSDTSITALSPAGAGTVDITATTSDGTSATSSADRFTYLIRPAVTAVSPDTADLVGGTVITITGTGFTGATAVTFNRIPATRFTVIDDHTITAVSPAMPAGSAPIHVTGPAGSAAGVAFTFAAAIAPAAATSTLPVTGTNPVWTMLAALIMTILGALAICAHLAFRRVAPRVR